MHSDKQESSWYMRQENGTEVYGPVTEQELIEWACDGRIMPNDKISEDALSWMAAKDMKSLGMTVKLERADGVQLGPYNPKAIESLEKEGKIPTSLHRVVIEEENFGDNTEMSEENLFYFPDEDRSSEDTMTEMNLEQIKQEASDEIALLKRESDDLRLENQELSSKLEALNKQVAECETLPQELERVKADLEKKIEENTSLAQRVAECETLTQELERVKQELDHKKSECVILIGELDAERERDVVPTAKLIASEDEVVKLKNSLDSASSTIEGLKQTLEEKEAQFNEEKNALIEKHAVSLKEVETKLLEQENLSKEQLDSINKLKEEIDNCNNEYTELLEFSNERDKETLEKIKVLEERISEYEKHEQEALEAEKNHMTRREYVLEEELKKAYAEKDLLNDKITELSARQITDEIHTDKGVDLIKEYADEAVGALRKLLEEEENYNIEARAKSVERQTNLHDQIDRLSRILNRDPGDLTRAEKSEQMASKQIAVLQQELEAERRHHQADMARAEANEKALEQRCRMLIHREAVAKDQLAKVESRTSDYDSLQNLLRRRESALLAAEKEFEEARQQWQMMEETLQHRIEELEKGAGLLFDQKGQAISGSKLVKRDVSEEEKERRKAQTLAMMNLQR